MFANVPCTSRGRRDVRNAQDGLYASGGRDVMLAVKSGGSGYAASCDIGLSICWFAPVVRCPTLAGQAGQGRRAVLFHRGLFYTLPSDASFPYS